jgi:hypothetical protein
MNAQIVAARGVCIGKAQGILPKASMQSRSWALETGAQLDLRSIAQNVQHALHEKSRLRLKLGLCFFALGAGRNRQLGKNSTKEGGYEVRGGICHVTNGTRRHQRLTSLTSILLWLANSARTTVPDKDALPE